MLHHASLGPPKQPCGHGQIGAVSGCSDARGKGNKHFAERSYGERMSQSLFSTGIVSMGRQKDAEEQRQG